MSVAFEAAWMLLKNQVRRGHRGLASNPRVPMTEDAYSDRPYGNISYRESPLHGLEDDDEGMGGPSMPPMSRTLGGTPPPNIGRAGSTNAVEPSSQEYLSDVEQQLQEMGLSPEEINYEINNMTPRNPFPKSPRPKLLPPQPFPPHAGIIGKSLEGRVQDQLAAFADGAGRQAAMSPQPDYTGDEFSMNSDDFKYDDESKLEESHPEAHNIASTNLRQTPRKQKRGMMDSGQAFKRPGFRGPAMPLPGGKGD